MIPALIRTALRYRLAVSVMAILTAGLGVWSFLHQQIDAYPDI
jgi:Cu/Ag efflux pump CusA